NYLFPEPQVLAEASLRDIGMTKVRELAIRELAKRVSSGELKLSRSAPLEETKNQLLAIRGIGPWTVEMIAMRCLGDCNAFPRSDLVVRRSLEKHRLQKGDWSPWNAYVTLALWKDRSTTASSNRPLEP